MTTEFTAAERAALDTVAVPAMRAGFAGDVVSVATGEMRVPPRRAGRGGWRRHGRVLLGVGALVVASATAAATGLLERLPIAIPGITRVAEKPVEKPKHVARGPRLRESPGREVLASAAPAPDPSATPSPPLKPWQIRRQERMAAGLPVRRNPLVRRAILAKLRAMPPEQRAQAVAEWRRIKALPPAERKAAMTQIRRDYLASHPKVAARIAERRAERGLAPLDGTPPAVTPGVAPSVRPGLRTPLTDAERAARRQRWREWRARPDAMTPPTPQQ